MVRLFRPEYRSWRNATILAQYHQEVLGVPFTANEHLRIYEKHRFRDAFWPWAGVKDRVPEDIQHAFWALLRIDEHLAYNYALEWRATQEDLPTAT